VRSRRFSREGLEPADRPWFKHWPSGVPRHIEYPEKPLTHLLEESAGKHSRKTAFVCGSETISFRELHRRSSAFAAAMRSIGVGRNDRVLILLPNRIEFVVSFYGTLRSGASVVTLNHMARAEELSRAVGETEPKLAVILSRLGPAEKEVLSRSGVLLVEVGELSSSESLEFSRLISTKGDPPEQSPRAEDPAVVQYTGATTGAPKPVVMSHSNLLANAVQNATWFGWTSDEKVLGVLPLCHTWGCSCCMNSPIYSGATVFLVERFEADMLLQTIEKARATVLYGSATMFSMLLENPAMEKTDVRSLKWVKAGAMPVPRELKRNWDRKTGIELLLGYGLTEASPETHNSPPEKVKEGTIGIPIIDTDAKLVDVDSDREVGAADPGELLIRGPQVTTHGYLNDRQETEEVLKGGWLHTGDIATMDTDGYFKLVDRKKDIIKCKGYSIYPVELEDILYSHPAVREACVVAKKHPVYGEIPKAFVVSKEGAFLTEKEILDFCGKRISPQKRIREVEFIGEIPKTHVGKVLRRRLRD
jgi:long-chain acyl-CoA synthetase